MLYYNLLAAGIYKIFAIPQIASGFSFGYRRRAVFPAFRYMHDCYRVSIAKFKIFDKPVMHFRFNVGKCSKIFQCAVRKIKYRFVYQPFSSSLEPLRATRKDTSGVKYSHSH